MQATKALARKTPKWAPLSVSPATKQLIDETAETLGWRRKEVVEMAILVFREAKRELLESNAKARANRAQEAGES